MINSSSWGLRLSEWLNEKNSMQTVAHRIIAGFLAIGGTALGALMVITFLLPKAGLILNLVYLPGWLVFAAWNYLAFGNTATINIRRFWIFSACVNTVYLLIHFSPIEIAPDFLYFECWWVISITLSLIAAAIPCPPKNRGVVK